MSHVVLSVFVSGTRDHNNVLHVAQKVLARWNFHITMSASRAGTFSKEVLCEALIAVHDGIHACLYVQSVLAAVLPNIRKEPTITKPYCEY